jgi:hypothetical protein
MSLHYPKLTAGLGLMASSDRGSGIHCKIDGYANLLHVMRVLRSHRPLFSKYLFVRSKQCHNNYAPRIIEISLAIGL